MIVENKGYEIQSYAGSNKENELRRTHVSFCGLPYKKPNDPKKIILIVNPLSTKAFHYEFRSEDITHAEKLPSIVSMEGEATPIARIWVKQGSIGMHSTQFLVENHTVMTQAKTRLP